MKVAKTAIPDLKNVQVHVTYDCTGESLTPTHHYYNMGYLILLEIKCNSYNYNYRENYTVLLTLREIKYNNYLDYITSSVIDLIG